MSSEAIAIAVASLGKCYEIYAIPGDRLKQFILPRIQQLFGRPQARYFREFWALREVSFEIRRGETIGIIGRNGSGKSTLLQMICGTLSPTQGSIKTYGRIAALLELGSGFNPEFSGRENVYLNATVLGLSQQEIDQRFDSIVGFADVGDFIEQPVKTYSSGMFVRLAFAVAVHVSPDILVVDEALSVGDIAFQNKCIERIKLLQSQGTTLLFISHDMSTLQMICDRVIWLDRGHVVADGDPVTVCQNYQVSTVPQLNVGVEKLPAILPQQRTGMAEFTSFARLPSHVEANLAPGQTLAFHFSAKAIVALGRSVVALSIYRADGDWIVGQTSLEQKVYWSPVGAGDEFFGKILLEPLCLAPGDYRAACGIFSEDLSLCYAMTDVMAPFSVRSPLPNWGKIVHPCQWVPVGAINAAADGNRVPGTPPAGAYVQEQ